MLLRNYEKAVHIYQTIWSHNPEDTYLQFCMYVTRLQSMYTHSLAIRTIDRHISQRVSLGLLTTMMYCSSKYIIIFSSLLSVFPSSKMWYIMYIICALPLSLRHFLHYNLLEILTEQLVMTVDLKQLKTISNVAEVTIYFKWLIFTWLLNIVFTALTYATWS